jgi:hypothetical protein
MRTCKRCNKEKEETEYRGQNKTCSNCIDYNRKYETKNQTLDYFSEYRKGLGKSFVSKHNREYQSKKYRILKSRRFDFLEMDSLLTPICSINNITKYQISGELNIPIFRERNSYFHNLSILTFAVLKYGNESDKQEFLNLINKKNNDK